MKHNFDELDACRPARSKSLPLLLLAMLIVSHTQPSLTFGAITGWDFEDGTLQGSFELLQAAAVTVPEPATVAMFATAVSRSVWYSRRRENDAESR